MKKWLYKIGGGDKTQHHHKAHNETFKVRTRTRRQEHTCIAHLLSINGCRHECTQTNVPQNYWQSVPTFKVFQKEIFRIHDSTPHTRVKGWIDAFVYVQDLSWPTLPSILVQDYQPPLAR